MTARIHLDLSGLAALADRLETALDRLPAEIAGILREDVRRQFAVGGEPAWQPLSPDTIAEKRKAGYPRLNRKGLVPVSSLQGGHFGPENILMRTMALYSSWTDAGDPNHFEELSPEGVWIGSTLVYAATHQYGDTREAWGKHTVTIPARPLVVTDRAQRDIAALIQGSLMEGN